MFVTDIYDFNCTSYNNSDFEWLYWDKVQMAINVISRNVFMSINLVAVQCLQMLRVHTIMSPSNLF